MIVVEIASMDIALSLTSRPEGASPIYLLKRFFNTYYEEGETVNQYILWGRPKGKLLPVWDSQEVGETAEHLWYRLGNYLLLVSTINTTVLSRG